MAPLSGMETVSARLASFENALPVPKRRGSNARGQKTITWPHATPTPQQLAEAGLYYNPTASSHDNTTCFLCKNEIEGWEEEDEPDVEHLKLSGSCGWAIIRSIGQEGQDPSTMEDPTGERLLEARLATFGEHWPHEHKRGWVCKTEKMAAAGWHFAPTADCEDFVTCAYCSLSLDGWEPKDSPFDEHYRRSPGCPFFVFAESGQPKKRRKTGRVGKRKASTAGKTKGKTPQLSMPGTFSPLMDSVDPSMNSLAAPASPPTTLLGQSAQEPSATSLLTPRNDDDELPLSLNEVSPTIVSHPQNGKSSSPSARKDASSEEGTLEDATLEENSSRATGTSRRKRSRESTATPAPTDSSPTPQNSSTTPRRSIIASANTNTNFVVTPSPSPQSSDAENHPPSSRPASVRPPLAPLSPQSANNNNQQQQQQPSLSPQRIPIAPGTPKRLQPSSPSKIGGLQSQLHWNGVDVDLIFATTPEKDKDNDENKPKKQGGSDGVGLTSPEKAMTVEEWIRSKAMDAETELRAEAERVVGVFEREGGRAMRVLEGIEVV